MEFSFSFNDPQSWIPLLLPFASAIVILIVGFLVAKPAQRAFVRYLSLAGTGTRTIAPLLGQALRYGIILFAVVTALGFFGVPQTSIFTVLGAASLAIALALQNTLSNIAAGIMLAWLQPIAVGEYITGDGVEGEVVEVGLFGTRLRSASGLFVFTPNNKLWNGAITNHSREPHRRVDVNVTIPDSADIGKARTTLLGIASHDKRVLKEPVPAVIVAGIGTDTVSLQLRAWVATPDYRDALRGMTEKTKIAIRKMLSAGGGGEATVEGAADPHMMQSGASPTPD